MRSTNENGLDPAHERGLLRRLRDLNLCARNVLVRGGVAVSLDGCLSLDRPVELGVAYRLRGAAGAEEVLRLEWNDGELAIRIEGREREARVLCARFALDDRGRAVSRELRARVDVERPGVRALEHFMRRVVRTVLIAA